MAASKQAHTYTHTLSQCSPASVGLAQACPNKYVASRQSTYLNFHVWFIIIFWFHNSGYIRVHFFPVDIVLLYSGHCDHEFTFNKEGLSLLVSNEIDHPIICTWHQLQRFWVIYLNCL